MKQSWFEPRRAHAMFRRCWLPPTSARRTDTDLQVKEDVQTETKLIKELMRELAAFRHPPGSGERAGAGDAADAGEADSGVRAAHGGIAAVRSAGGGGGDDDADPDRWP